MKLISLFIFAFVLAGCASVVPEYNGEPVKKTIVWHKAKDMHEVFRICDSKYNIVKSKVNPSGCFWTEGSECHLVSIDSYPYLKTLGHEVKHCFDGLWHDAFGKPIKGYFLVGGN